jgi:hypothetical protein
MLANYLGKAKYAPEILIKYIIAPFFKINGSILDFNSYAMVHFMPL